METVFHAIGGHITPAAGAKILKSWEYATLLSANELLDFARSEAERIKKEAEAAYEERKAQGYADGVAEGQIEQAEKMMDTSMQALEYLEGLESKIVDVVTTAVRKIIGELEEKERIVRIVRTALEQVRGRQRVIVRVSPEEEAYVREALRPMLSQVASSSIFEVVADQRMKAGDCLLESEMGVMDASLSVQLEAIERALRSRVGGGQS